MAYKDDAHSIRIHAENKRWLDSLKLYERETIDGVLTRLRTQPISRFVKAKRKPVRS